MAETRPEDALSHYRAPSPAPRAAFRRPELP